VPGTEPSVRKVQWLAVAYVVLFGGVLVAVALGFGDWGVHSAAATYTLILGGLLIAAGIVLRPRPQHLHHRGTEDRLS
jgi:hypothetical protein